MGIKNYSLRNIINNFVVTLYGCKDNNTYSGEHNIYLKLIKQCRSTEILKSNNNEDIKEFRDVCILRVLAGNLN